MARFSLDWSSADLQGHMPCGIFDTREEAEAAKDAAMAELVAACASEEEAEGIRAGRMDITELDD